MAKGKRPGVVIYFDLRPGFKRLSFEEKGHLLDALLDYGELGIEPEFDDALLSLAWDFIRPRLDADEERYRKRCEKAQDAANVRWERTRTDADGCERTRTDADDANSTKLNSENIVPTSVGTKKTGVVFEHDSLPYRAARWLADQIEARLPNCTPHTEATVQAWAVDFDRCNRLDGHNWDDINDVLAFSQSDPFWRKNILSGGKFRKQFTALLAQMGDIS